jgi:hypothetical protein
VIFFKFVADMEEHHMGGTPGLYTSGRSTSSSSSPGVAGSSPALLVVPQPINATKMGGMQNGGPQPRKYQCKMCPQVSQITTEIKMSEKSGRIPLAAGGIASKSRISARNYFL